ncbi:MAG: hypothetical protein J5639_08120 [Bacteroidales bacterium]|nr:hypothetical protein [Bacteroidales bacterium]
MKTTLKYIFLAFLVAAMTSCVPELPDLHTDEDGLKYPEEGKAEIMMSVEVPGNRLASTKTMGDLPDITSFRVVVFGSSGFLKESVEVASGDFVAATTNGSSTKYMLNVHLSVTDSKRLRINVIANCNKRLPWKNEDVVLNQNAYTEGTQDAYWCRFILPNGITLKKEAVWNPESESDEMVYVKVGEYYQATDDVVAAFTDLPMLRNFAKVSVESTTPQLVLDASSTMAVINRPDRGSVAPYRTADGAFLVGYRDSTYAQLKNSYNGFAPESMQLIDSDPDHVTFVPCGKDNTTGKITGGQFIFERPKPGAGDAPSYLIIHGIYYPLKSPWTRSTLPDDWKEKEAAAATHGTYVDYSSGKDSYYKIDFSDDDGYYAILRNFRYHIRITNVSKAGAETPGEAGSIGGSADISSDPNIVGLNDISDGYGRIAVSYVERTLVQGDPAVELKYKFIPNVDDGDASVNNKLVSEGGPVTITIGEKEGGSPINVFSSTLSSQIGTGTDIGNETNGKIRVLSDYQDTEGYRTIKFTCNTPSSQGKATQTIRISGTIDQYKTIYRDVKFILMEKQIMTVTCLADEPNSDYNEDFVEDISGEGVNVNITIPILLPESVFPLHFNIESSKLSITPNTAKYTSENLPVESGYSICEGNESKKSFHYVKTLSYAEYNELPENQDTGGKTFTCHFKTNMAESASTIYVTNEYFNRGSGAFRNYTMYDFSGLTFSNYRAAASTTNQPITLNFSFYRDSRDNTGARVVQVTLEGLLPGNDSGLTLLNADDGIYSYTINSGDNYATIPLRTTSAAAGFNGKYSVSLAAFVDGKALYHEAEIYNMDYSVVTVNTNNTSASYGTNRTELTVDGVTVKFSAINGRNNGYLQLADNTTITVTAPSGYHIANIVFNYTANNRSGTISGQGGTYSYNNPTGTWVVNNATTNSVALTITKRSSNNGNNARVSSIVVTVARDQ